MPDSAGKNVNFYFFLIYILVLLLYAFILPDFFFNPYQKKLVFLMGAVGLWRYSWFLLNNVRAYIYRKYKFKDIRFKEESGGEELNPKHLFLLLTTFKIHTSITVTVYREAIKDAIRSGYNTTIIASVVEMSEERVIRKIFLDLKPPSNIELVITRIKGTGKRDALAAGYRVVANSRVDLFNSVVAVIDGDSIVTPGTFKKCSRLFALDPELGGLTTDEDSTLLYPPKTVAEKIYFWWYKLRFAQRNVSMSSVSLADRILTLTGRMSMIRASIVADASFVETVQLDHVNHWRLGQFQFLTGDDKSSLYHVMKDGWKLLYVPDVMVYTVDELVSDSFIIGSLKLMHRWFGNQYRTNLKQLQVPNMRNITGNFPWYTILDQRISRWMTPYGFFISLFGSFHWGASIFLAYIWWVLFTRLLMTFAYRFSRANIHPLWPFLLYYNQLIGSFVKIYIWNHLYKQSWTRQKTKLKSGEDFVERYYRVSSNGMLVIQLLTFWIIIAFLVQLLTFEDIWLYINFLRGLV
jgi:glycosyltransferase Alg8